MFLSTAVHSSGAKIIMSDSEKEKSPPDADLNNNVEGSTVVAELYIDPVKEARMMRKFDVR